LLQNLKILNNKTINISKEPQIKIHRATPLRDITTLTGMYLKGVDEDIFIQRRTLGDIRIYRATPIGPSKGKAYDSMESLQNDFELRRLTKKEALNKR